jgi:fluoride ion exporter CrcB/FEX
MVNIIGCFVIVFFGLNERRLPAISTEARMFFAIGFLGRLPLFSTFSFENNMLLRDGIYIPFGLYTSFFKLDCLLATFFGDLLSKLFLYDQLRRCLNIFKIILYQQRNLHRDDAGTNPYFIG